MKKNRKRQLVFQYIDKISRKLLQKYPEVIRKIARGQHGIYALYKGDKLYYVGLASDLRRRLRHHLKDRHGKTWDRFSMYLTLSDAHLVELESLVLRIAGPRGNVKGGKFVKAKNLRRTVEARIREMQQRERKDLMGEEYPISRRKRKCSVEKDLGVLEPYVTRRFKIRFRYKGKLYIANVRTDGWITFDFRSAGSKKLKKQTFRSPSGACKAVLGRSCDGWRHWRYRNSKGEWVSLDKLRKKR